MAVSFHCRQFFSISISLRGAQIDPSEFIELCCIDSDEINLALADCSAVEHTMSAEAASCGISVDTVYTADVYCRH